MIGLMIRACLVVVVVGAITLIGFFDGHDTGYMLAANEPTECKTKGVFGELYIGDDYNEEPEPEWEIRTDPVIEFFCDGEVRFHICDARNATKDCWCPRGQ